MQFDNGIYLNIINSCKDCIFICNKEGKILFFNKSFSEKYKDKAHQEANIRDIFSEKLCLNILQIFKKD